MEEKTMSAVYSAMVDRKDKEDEVLVHEQNEGVDSGEVSRNLVEI